MKYSQGYKRDKQKGTVYTFWSKDFDGMAYKTMLRQLISKWGIMSIDMASAIDADMAVINEDGTKDYVANDPDVVDMEPVSASMQETPAVDPETDEVNDIQAALFGGE